MSTINTPLLMLRFLALFFSCVLLSSAADFYVAPTGSDTWSGKLAEPNEEKSDGPFASVERARDAIRDLKSEQNTVVQLRDGHYRLSKTIVFGVQDSGKGDATITYEAYPEEKPTFTSDVEITNWQKPATPIPHLPKAAQGKVWVADVSEKFLTLYDSQGRLPRARTDGFIPIKGAKKATKDRLTCPPGTLRNWPNLEDIDLIIRPNHAWVLNILPLSSVNPKKQTATTSIPASYGMNALHYLPNTKSAWIENVIDSLDQPGEWVLNTQEKKLYLWPRADGPPEGIMRPQLREFIRVEGQVDIDAPTDVPVRNLIFRGLSFTHGETYRITPEDKGLQHDWELHDKPNALLRLRSTENCLIEKCHFTQSGGTAIRLDLHSQNNRIQHNHLEHLGATGILISGYGPGTKDLTHHNLVFNNHIHNVGEIYAHGPGIFLWQSGENRVANNLIHHTPYAGIIISGVMTDFFSRGSNSRELVRTIRRSEVDLPRKRLTIDDVRPYLHSHDNLIELNEIHHAMQQLNDGNGIYIRGCGAGNIIRRNYIHDLLAPTVMQSSIRTDGGQRDTLITENLIYRCRAQGMQIKLNNRCINNIIADIRPGTHKGEERTPMFLKLYEGPLTGGAYQRNIFYHPGDEVVFYQETKNFRVPIGAFAKDADTDHNIYFCAGNPSLGQSFLGQKQKEGVDKNSLAQDPLFIDPANGDFRFHPDSPAHKLGIKAIDLSKIGLRKTP
ncbi:right-handed parallel beta-helix repeat-containing protein [Akkermansiaceae bacterium]|nr:right-handed parallel beta-helix repeat-containing protein [Akkermansiaceae bacterium]